MFFLRSEIKLGSTLNYESLGNICKRQAGITEKHHGQILDLTLQRGTNNTNNKKLNKDIMKHYLFEQILQL